MDMRHERGDVSKEEKNAQRRIKMSKEAMAEELESDDEALDMEGGVLENPIDVLVGMNQKGNHRVPTGMGEAMPLLYGGVGPGDIPDDDAEMFGEAYAWALFQAMDYTEREIPFDPYELGAEAYDVVLTGALQNSSEDRVIVPPKEPANPTPPENTYVNFPTETAAQPPLTLNDVLPVVPPTEAVVEPLKVDMPLEGGKDVFFVAVPREESVPPMLGKRPRVDAAKPDAKRMKEGGEKPKRKVSEWSKLVAAVYKELREKDPNVTIAMAAKEASKRRKA
jgi:hypothetical protein